MFDLLLQDASCLDLDSGNIQSYDIGISGKTISLVQQHLENSSIPAKHVIPCTGYYLFPGFLDVHTHLFAHGSTFGMDADQLLTVGTTYTVDMGSAGWVNYPAFRMCDLDGKKIGHSSFLNLSPVGQPGKGIFEPLNKAVISQSDMEQVIREFPGEITGIKIRFGQNIVGNLGTDPLRRAVELGDYFGLPLCVHTTDPPIPMSGIAKLLRPGDIFSHVYHGQGNTILQSDGTVDPKIIQAQARGVLLEVGNGTKNFDFCIAERAIAQGVFPDLITSDSTPASFHSSQSMWDLPLVMSKFLALGMSLSQVVRSVTETPARALGLETRLGFIRENYQADLVLCRIDQGERQLFDSFGNCRTGTQFIQPCLTILAGEVVYRSSYAPEYIYEVEC